MFYGFLEISNVLICLVNLQTDQIDWSVIKLEHNCRKTSNNNPLFYLLQVLFETKKE